MAFTSFEKLPSSLFRSFEMSRQLPWEVATGKPTLSSEASGSLGTLCPDLTIQPLPFTGSSGPTTCHRDPRGSQRPGPSEAWLQEHSGHKTAWRLAQGTAVKTRSSNSRQPSGSKAASCSCSREPQRAFPPRSPPAAARATHCRPSGAPARRGAHRAHERPGLHPGPSRRRSLGQHSRDLAP